MQSITAFSQFSSNVAKVLRASLRSSIDCVLLLIAPALVAAKVVEGRFVASAGRQGVAIRVDEKPKALAIFAESCIHSRRDPIVCSRLTFDSVLL